MAWTVQNNAYGKRGKGRKKRERGWGPPKTYASLKHSKDQKVVLCQLIAGPQARDGRVRDALPLAGVGGDEQSWFESRATKKKR